VLAERADVAVIGAGPAGSAAALVLARAGARVALVDKTAFPRDKACGDLVGPRGVQVLEDLGVHAAGAEPVGDMRVVGPTGGRSGCRADPAGPIRVTVSRSPVSSSTRRSAPPLSTPAASRARLAPAHRYSTTGGWRASSCRTGPGCTPTSLSAPTGDEPGGDCGRPGRRGPGAVGVRAALLPRRVRRPADDRVVGRDPLARLPRLRLGLPRPGGRANLGVGVGVLGDRAAAGHAARSLGAFVGVLHRFGLLDRSARLPAARLGGWLKMGMVGTVPARGRVLLVGDAAGLVNPLQGEGSPRPWPAGGQPPRPSSHARPLRPPSTARSWRSATPPSTRRTPPSRPRSCGEPPSSPRQADSSLPLSSGVPSPAAGPSTGTSCSTALPRERPGTQPR
jgi:hypothetical protein